MSLFGPIVDVTSTGSRKETRYERHGPSKGEQISVNVDTHVETAAVFASGLGANIVTSFDAPRAVEPSIVVTGTEGELWLPDPVTYGRAPWILNRKTGARELVALPPLREGERDGLGHGLRELAESIWEERPPRLSLELAAHIVDTMLAVHESLDSGQPVKVNSTFEVGPADPVKTMEARLPAARRAIGSTGRSLPSAASQHGVQRGVPGENRASIGEPNLHNGAKIW